MPHEYQVYRTEICERIIESADYGIIGQNADKRLLNTGAIDWVLCASRRSQWFA